MNPLIEALTQTDTFSTEVSDYDLQQLKNNLMIMRDHFIDDRVRGREHPITKQPIPPISREQAEAQWNALTQRYQQYFLQPRSLSDPVSSKLRPKPRITGSDYRDPEGAQGAVPPEENWDDFEKSWEDEKQGKGQRAMADEPSLRRGESLSRRAIKALMR